MTNEPTVESKMYDKRSNGVVYAVQCNNEIQERTNNKVLLLQEQRSAVLFSLFLFVCVRVCDERKNAPTKVLSVSLVVCAHSLNFPRSQTILALLFSLACVDLVRM